MSRALRLYRSNVGKKAIVAVTGSVMLGFLVLHVIGNLKVFAADPSPGVPDIDVYGEWLRSMGEPILPHGAALWLIRAVVGSSLILHLVCVFQLALHNRRARPVAYAHKKNVEATAPARWMLYSGSLILVFIVVHILQFTTGTIDASRFVPGAIYRNLYDAFQHWYYAAFYFVAVALVGLHLYHGAWSLFQTLGADNPDRNRALRRFALVASVGLFLTFVSVPVAFFTGALGPPSGPAVAAVGDPSRSGR